jgi:hypothetical protein
VLQVLWELQRVLQWDLLLVEENFLPVTLAEELF